MEEEENNDPELTPILPRDLMLLILCRLPVKALVKFRCVKKSWYGVVKDPRLVKLHFDHYSKPENGSFITIRNKGLWRAKSKLLMIRPGFSEPEKLGVKERGWVSIVGSSNGLICLTYMHLRFGLEFKVMNPALREQYRHVYTGSGQLHEYDHWSYKRYCMCVGFGFDNKNRDYKIFRAEHVVLHDQPRLVKVNLYSLRSNSWKMIQTPQSILFNVSHRCMVTLGSWLYCLSFLPNGGRSITGFDLTSETFHTIPPPESRNLHCLQIVAWEIDQSLAAIFVNRECNTYELWSVSPGVVPINKDSWKMKTSLRFRGLPVATLQRLIRWYEGFNDFPIVWRHKKSYCIVYLCKNHLPAEIINSCQKVCWYKESLVPLFSVHSSGFY